MGLSLLVGAIMYGLISSLTRPGQQPSEEAPGPLGPLSEDTGRVQGYVLDAGTGQSIPLAEIYVDGRPNTTADMTGGFRTSYMEYGAHVITIYASGYQTTDFQITLQQSLLQHNFALEPIEPVPGFPDDIEISGIVVEPETVLIGEAVSIGVQLLGPYPDLYPRTVSGTIAVDGGQLTETIEMTYRNPTMWFSYTPASAKVYAVTAKNRSAIFEVLENIAGPFYCPFGCINPETETGAWNDKQSLLGSWVNMTNPSCCLYAPWLPSPPSWCDYTVGQNCVVAPRFYGGGTGATGYEGTVYCPFCGEAMRTGRSPGDCSYLWRLAEMLFNHVQSAHPDIPWDKPPAWIQLTGFDIFCARPGFERSQCDCTIFLDGSELLRLQSYAASVPMVIALGTHQIVAQGLALSAGYLYQLVTLEHSVTVSGWGDKLTLNVQTGHLAVEKWDDLVAAVRESEARFQNMGITRFDKV